MAHAWEGQRKVSKEDNERITMSFSVMEIGSALEVTRMKTAPGPDGVPIIIQKKMWSVVGPQILQLIDAFTRGLI